MTKKVLFMLAMLTCIFASCSDGGSDDPVNPTPKPEEVKAEITLDSTIESNGLSFGTSAGDNSVSFTTNTNWTLTVSSTTGGTTWCTASATSGSKGSATVKFTVTENTEYDDRSVSVTVKAGTASKTFKVTQKGVDALLVTTSSYEVAQEGGSIEVEVKANIDYQLEISEAAKGWITEAKSKSRALKATNHKFDIAFNEDAEKREGEIIFKSGDKVETVKVYQAGGALIMLTQNELTVSDAGETISVEIKSNVEFGVQMPEVDWITDEASSRGMSSHTLKYVIAPNEGYDSRTAEIIFYDKNSDLKDTLKVVQAQKDAILVAKNEYTIDAIGGDLKFEINTNVDFEISTSADWIKQNTESRALETKPLNFTIEENTADEAREGLITVSSGELKQEIKVLQKAKTVFSISNTEFNIASEGGEVKVEISTNGEYSITMPEVDWLKENETRAALAFTHAFTISANETYDARESEIIFVHKETEEVIKVKVVQAQKDAIVISQKEYNVKAEGETIEVKLSTNVDFEVTMPDVDWIEQVSSRALNEHTLYFKVAKNESKEKRKTEIVFKDKNSQISDKLIINQFELLEEGYMNGVVTVATAGTMKKLLGDDFLNITTLKIVGFINGDDVYYLRKMLGGSNFNKADWGKLTTLDLSEAVIVEGGECYNVDNSEQLYTSNNVIGDCMFKGCANLQSIKLPESVISINEDAFYDCSSLTSINIPVGVTSIGEWAFYNCSSLISLSIPDGVTSIGANAFYYCTSLASISLPTGVTSINEDVFYGCSSLTSINIPDGVTSIDSGAFSGCSSLASVNIPVGVTSIGGRAFMKCTSLTSINIPYGVTSISERIFSECSALISVNIPDNVTSIGANAFYHCTSLTSINIPDDVTSIGANAFWCCFALTSINIPDNVTSIGEYAFYGCTSLTSISIPDNVTSIGKYALSSCSELKSVTIGDGVTEVPDYFCYKCAKLSEVKIGKNIKSLGVNSFFIGKDTWIDKFYCYASLPPELLYTTKYVSSVANTDYYGTFCYITDNTWHTSRVRSETKIHTLYVPARCGQTYRESDWGGYFNDLVEID